MGVATPGTPERRRTKAIQTTKLYLAICTVAQTIKIHSFLARSRWKFPAQISRFVLTISSPIGQLAKMNRIEGQFHLKLPRPCAAIVDQVRIDSRAKQLAQITLQPAQLH